MALRRAKIEPELNLNLGRDRADVDDGYALLGEDDAEAEPTRVGHMSRAMIDELMLAAEVESIVLPQKQSGVREALKLSRPLDEPLPVSGVSAGPAPVDQAVELYRSLPPVTLRPAAFTDWIPPLEPKPAPLLDAPTARNIAIGSAVAVVFVTLLVWILF